MCNEIIHLMGLFFIFYFFKEKNILILIKSLYTDNGAKYQNPNGIIVLLYFTVVLCIQQ